MNLAIDIGNTSAKMVVIEKGQVIDNYRIDELDTNFLGTIFEQYPNIDAAIMVSGRAEEHELEVYLQSKVGRYIRFDHSTPVPLVNLYGTPQTLGSDRLAAAVGANTIYPDSNVMIVDFGTAITIDMVSENNEFLGGNISPGATTRFRSLHDYTGKLPMGALREKTSLIARDSMDAIESGVINGVVYEIEGYISAFEEQFSDLRIIFTGGDGNFFAKRVKKTIFATYDLVVYGLNRILEYNAD